MPQRPPLDKSHAAGMRRLALICIGAALGLMVSPHAHDSTMAMIAAAGLAFAFVILLARYGLAS